MKVLRGRRLEKPQDMPQIVYMLCNRCWDRKRPSFTGVLDFLEKVFEKFKVSLCTDRSIAFGVRWNIRISRSDYIQKIDYTVALFDLLK